MSDSVWPHRQQPNRLLCPWDSPGKSTGVGCHCLLRPKPPPLFKTEQCSPGNLRQYFRYGSQVLICLSPQNTLNCILCKEIRPLKCYGNTTSGWDRPQMTQWSPQSVIPLVTVGSYPEGQHTLSALISLQRELSIIKDDMNYVPDFICSEPWHHLWKGKSLNSLASVFMDDRLALCFFLMSQVRVLKLLIPLAVPA